MAGLSHPIEVDGRGRFASVDITRRIRNMIENVLFTAPGERVNRPTFGSGIRQLLFSPTSPALAAAVRANVEGALQVWLGDVIVVENVEAESVESTLNIRVTYRMLPDGERRAETYSVSRGGEGLTA
jgi:phage baseplate assembly protein W